MTGVQTCALPIYNLISISRKKIDDVEIDGTIYKLDIVNRGSQLSFAFNDGKYQTTIQNSGVENSFSVC